MTDEHIMLGRFVRVGNDMDVVVGLPNQEGVPDEHYAIWYGQRMPDGVTPLARTVPAEYCVVVGDFATYH